MQPLFSEQGEQRLDSMCHPGLLCAFDFDGTLAPIVSKPELVKMPDTVRDALCALAEHAPVAIITGRSVEDIRAKLPFEPDFVVGNHGIEGVPGWDAQAAAHRSLARQWQMQLVQLLQEAGDDPGIHLEDKRYSLSVHYRMSSDPERAAGMLRVLIEQLSPKPRVVAGKYVFNLVPEDAAHKGSALEELMRCTGADGAIYVGDDVTDEDVFRLRRPDLLSIRIERAAHSAADFYLQSPQDMLQVLQELAGRLRARNARNWVHEQHGRASSRRG